ncbi:MAG: hypothetical protein QXM54_04250 [Desulfurococcaceae archaeon]
MNPISCSSRRALSTSSLLTNSTLNLLVEITLTISSNLGGLTTIIPSANHDSPQAL